MYRWRLRPGHEQRFQDAWSIVTRALVEQGSLGSRLHIGDDGLWYSYAQWPSEEARAAAFATSLNIDDAQRTMDDAVSERFPEIVLTSSVDHLLINPTTPRLRVARPTFDVDRAVNFWSQVVGLEILSHFENHDGYDGVIMGYPNTEWEIEVTRHSSGLPLPTPTEEDIIALYVGIGAADEIIKRLLLAGYPQIKHSNPYWESAGASVHVDPDGYAFVIHPEK